MVSSDGCLSPRGDEVYRGPDRPSRGRLVCAGESTARFSEDRGADAGSVEGDADGADRLSGEQPPARSEVDAVLTGLRCAYDAARIARAQAQLTWLEAKAQLELCEKNEGRLGAAIAAMTGEAGPQPAKIKKTPSPDSEGAINPRSHLKCAACGETGTMVPTRMETRSGGSLNVLVCTACRNQALLS